MKKKSIICIGLSLAMLPSLFSCNFFGTASSKTSASSIGENTSVSTAGSSAAASSSLATSSSSSSSSSASVTSSDEKAYEQVADAEKYDFNKNKNLTCMGDATLNSLGTKKILVIPVTFKNCATFTSAQLAKINKAYNGEASDTGWQSLKSYYETASYGKLTIESVIADPYVVQMNDYETDATIADTAKDTSFEGRVYNQTYSTGQLADDIVKSYSSKYNMADFDLDNDGLVDGVEMVYIGGREWVNGSDDPTSVWWNFTYIANTTNNEPNTHIAGVYFWSQLTMLENGYYSTDIDTHTLVHESGHMLGLDDYYSYDYDSNGRAPENPCGIVDMMDGNIGDQNAFSKWLLGWTSPKYLTGKVDTFDLTLNSFADTGDCLILRNTSTDPWNGMPYDEYLMLEYYTPTKLNEQDSVMGYPEWKRAGTGGCYKKPGLKVFHVDARLANVDTSDLSTLAYTDTLSRNLFYAASNTGSSSMDINTSKKTGEKTYNSPYRLIEAVPATGIDYFGSSDYSHLGDQTVLFGNVLNGCGGLTFSMEKMKSIFPNGTLFNDGSTLDYDFMVTNQTDSNITLHFSRV
ncbi:MAG: hypothetical protein LKJ88_03180 [Bacilli bacterium]|jgi:M6 family metalloprotease-like protein|nr:hypothetical protein [Bacilli bacterium]